MALGKKRIVAQKSNLKHRRDIDNGGLGLGLEFIHYKKEFGRKRILIEDFIFASPVCKVSSKKLCDRTTIADGQRNLQLEDLPHDILVKIICGVEREDLKALIFQSKTINEATETAKESHFAYTTPRKTSVFNNGGFGFDIEDNNDDDEIEAPGAPLQQRYRPSRINRDKDDSGISMALFH